ncbi:hypothetical protein, conserved [Eimeria tenella]|uniref:Transmembrane protein n=1 Tax=Eimeria tenella TaxID=5802 RepID=U6KJY0_EIMTE|nr:hypothetical protein, conserved [Eimeria tenella]CDJ37111.1 hypothetical protein, conserved [Eimeria tenella]|eukprot:XP_013227949.1 hypothetical protein, conserved [Eimeria tenella]
MLQANKATVLTDFNLESLSIQFLEIDYFILVFSRVTRVASLLAGFASAALMQAAGSPGGHRLLQLLHILATGGALCFMLLVLLLSTLCSMWGPGLALRGSGPSSVAAAVKAMDQAQQTTLRLFNLGLFCFVVSSSVSALLFQSALCCCILIILYFFIGFEISSSSKDIKQQLLPRALASGEIKGNPLAQSAAAAAAAEEAAAAAADSCCPSDSFQCLGSSSSSSSSSYFQSRSSTVETIKFIKCPAVQTPQQQQPYAAATTQQNQRFPSLQQQQQQQPYLQQQHQQSFSLHEPNYQHQQLHHQQQLQQQQQQQQEEEEEILGDFASSAYTSIARGLSLFLGLEGEETGDT